MASAQVSCKGTAHLDDYDYDGEDKEKLASSPSNDEEDYTTDDDDDYYEDVRNFIPAVPFIDYTLLKRSDFSSNSDYKSGSYNTAINDDEHK